MISYFAGVVAARTAVVLSAVTIMLPYLLRRNSVSQRMGFSQWHGKPYLKRLWPHFWMGYGILVLTLFHTATITKAMAHANQGGVVAATIAFVLLTFEVLLGLSMKNAAIAGRSALRRIHYWLMLGFISLLATHLWLNA